MTTATEDGTFLLATCIYDTLSRRTSLVYGNGAMAICYINGRDIGELQVLAGHARDCPRYSRGRYEAAETHAQAGGRKLSAIYPLPAYCSP